MNSQIDMDAIKISAQMWYAEFRRKFDETWNEGLEEPQPVQPMQQPMQQELIGGAEEMQNPLPPMGGLENAQ